MDVERKENEMETKKIARREKRKENKVEFGYGKMIINGQWKQ